MRICVSVSSKLLIMLIASGVSAALTVGALGYYKAQDALKTAIDDQLVAIRESKKADIVRYFEGQERMFQVFASQRQLQDASEALAKGFAAEGKEPAASTVSSLQDFYRKEFLPRFLKSDKTPTLGDYWPRGSAAVRLQQAYIAGNPNPAGQRLELGLNGEKLAEVGSYSDAHNRFHPDMVKAMRSMRLYDVFVIDARHGDVIYTAQKEADFATNLDTGPYRNSNLAKAFHLARDNQLGPQGVAVVDFEHYEASFGDPSAFIAAPIVVDGEIKAVVAGQLSIDDLNATLTSSGHWESEGLGKTGEVYLVGSDGLGRSDSRFLIEDKKGYLETLGKLDVPKTVIAAIEASNHSILSQKFSTLAVQRALNGETGHDEINDYRGEPVLSAYAPIDVAGMRWSIVAEKDVAEAFAPLYALRNSIFVATGLMAILITFFSMLSSRYFLGPIARLQAGVARLRAGETRFSIPIAGTDEFEELVVAFNDMLSELDQRNQVIATKTLEYQKLLRNILPDAVAERVSGGDTLVADTFPNVTIIYAAIFGFGSIMGQSSASTSIGLLNELVDGFDEAAERHGVEKIKTLGDAYMAACGLSTPRLDHRVRAIAFAEEISAILKRFNEAKGTQLRLQVGVATGEVDAGIVGRRRFVYEILGECVVEARQLALAEGHSGISISPSTAAAS